MSGRKTIARGIAGTFGLLAVLLLALGALMPRWINGEAVKAGIFARVSSAAGGSVRYERLDLSFFPRPRIIVHRLELAIPHRAAGVVESLALYPALFPLVRGGYHLTKVRADAPDLVVEIPRPAKEEKPPSLAEIRERIADLLSALAVEAPEMVFEVHRGRVALSLGPRPLCALREIEGRIVLPPKRLEVDLRCASNLWGNLVLNGRLDASELSGRGTIELVGLDLAPFAESFLPEGWRQMAAGRADLGAGFEIERFRTLKAVARGASPSLSVRRGSGSAGVSGLRFGGTIEIDEAKTVVSDARMSLESPRLQVSGRLALDRAAPRAELELHGGDIDIAPVRGALLALAGDIAGVRKVLDYVRGGRLTLTALKIEGPAISGRGAIGRLSLEGRLGAGNIFVPDGDLDLRDVAGNVVLSGGILTAEHAEARIGESRAREGFLRMGVTGRDPPFRIDTRVEAGLAQLPRILLSLIKDKGLEDELSLIEDIQGKTSGQLTIGDRIGSLRVAVDATELRLSARYRRVPFPVEVDGGRLLFDENGIAVERLSGRMGRSAFSGVAARVHLGDSPAFERLSGNMSVALGEFYPWLASLNGMERVRENVRRLDGFMELVIGRLDGPIGRPVEWRYEADGSLRGVLLESTRLPGPVAVAKGAFRLSRETVSVTSLDARFLDAAVLLSGQVDGYRKPFRMLDSTLSGKVGPDALRWIWDAARLPPDLIPRAPVSVSSGRMVLDRDGTFSIAGSYSLRGGPALSGEFIKPRDGFDLRHLAVQDEESLATIDLRLREKELDVGFSGHLARATVSRLFPNAKIRHGWIAGDLRAHIPLNRPAHSTAHGHLVAKEIHLPRLMGPMAIEDLSLRATGNRIAVTSSAIDWGKTRFSLTGEAIASGDALNVDVDLVSDGIVWDDLRATLPVAGRTQGAPATGGIAIAGGGSGVPWPLPINGAIRLAAGSLTVGEYVWKPVRADIVLRREEITTTIREADLCGISSTGSVHLGPAGAEVDLRLSSRGRELQTDLSCLRHQRIGMTGTYELEGHISGRGTDNALVRDLHGDVAFRATKGRVYRLNLLSKILALLNVTQLFLGKVPDLAHDGFAYNSLSIKGTLSDGKLKIGEVVLDGSSMNIVGKGEVDVRTGKVDIVALASPLKTVDTILRRIPVVGYILGGSLVSVAVKAEGDLDDPTVSILPPSEVVKGLLGVAERVLKLPVRIFEGGVP
ncbi:AsmA-like C-terminal domain-containing protein [Candidatus Deferrimicrobium sp.]|uniref:YhdP family protein n=1 Tax=Candidatus Deferrimicrobium sp. TaxID=3060586 RepID=UPI002ED2E75D